MPGITRRSISGIIIAPIVMIDARMEPETALNRATLKQEAIARPVL
jgi:hypothetical protein